MKVSGGCYCGQVRYESDGEPALRAQCFCRECQYISGGDSVLVLGMPEAGYRITKGAPKAFRRSDIPKPVTREFCPNCGTHLTTRAMPGIVMLKIGTLDDPTLFEAPQMAIYTCDRQPYHHVPSAIPNFDKLPG
jgi:hypothetical protein